PGISLDGIFNGVNGPGGYAGKFVNAALVMGLAYPIITQNVTAAAPTCSVASGGTLPITTWYYAIAPMFSNGAEGNISYQSTGQTTSTGNQTVNCSWPAVPGAIGYDVYKNNGGGSQLIYLGGCAIPQVTGLSMSDTVGTDCAIGTSTIPSGGPAGMQGGQLWGLNLTLPAVTAPSGLAGTTKLYMDSTANWLTSKSNGNTAYVHPGFLTNTVWAAGQCATLSATTWALIPAVCGIPAFSGLPTGVNNSAQTLTVGSTSTLTYSGTGFVNARQIVGIDFNGDVGCSSSTYLRGDGTCATPTGSGNVTGPVSATGNDVAAYNGITGTIILDSGLLYTNLTTQASNGAANQVCTYTGANKICVPGSVTNTMLSSATTTVNSQACTLGSPCTIPFQVNSSNQTSQAGINEVTSTVNSVGLTDTPINTGTNVVEHRITGSSYTGNAATATALAVTPTQCSDGTPLATGIAANGNANCTSASTLSFPVTVTGTVNSGGVPYFSNSTTMSSSAVFPSGDFVLGGGAGNAPTATFSVVPP